jgi:predicted phage tail protein
LEIILDESTQEAQNELYPPRARFQWRESDGASGYQVEVWNGVNWITRATVTEADSGYYWYQTQALTDGVDYEYRVRAVDTNDNAGEPIEFEVNLVRNPAPPSVTIELDSAGDIVVEAL